MPLKVSNQVDYSRYVDDEEENDLSLQSLQLKYTRVALWKYRNFTTSAGVERLKQIREWTARELEETGEMQYKHLFYFTLLQKEIDPTLVWVNTTWLPLYENVAVALLGI